MQDNPTLTPSQQKAADEFLGFYLSPDPVFVLTGEPGTGKSFLLKHLIESLPDTNQLAKVVGRPEITEHVVFATTNKAAEIITNSTGFDAVTVDKGYGFVITTDFKTGKQSTTVRRDADVLKNQFIVIDEGSMLDPIKWNLIQKRSIDSKLLIIGDEYQLWPVGHTESVVFTQGYPTATLTDPMRQNKDTALYAYIQQLKRAVISNGTFFEKMAGLVDNQTVTFLNDEGVRQLYDFFYKECPGKFAVKTVARSNERVLMHNNLVREIIGASPFIEKGDFVVSNDSTLIRSSVPDYDNDILMKLAPNPSASISVENNESRTITERTYQVLSVSEQFRDTYLDFTFRKYVMSAGKSTVIVYVPDNVIQFKQKLKALARQCKTGNAEWHKFYWYQDNFGDLRFPYASTVHKAQGSTYGYVLIDLQDIFQRWPDPAEAARLLYVAVSRAKYGVYLYGILPRKFGG